MAVERVAVGDRLLAPDVGAAISGIVERIFQLARGDELGVAHGARP